MKRPNRKGCVTKLSGKRRKPWVAKITKGFTDKGKQITKIIGTFTTRYEAENSLNEFIRDPYDLETNNIKFKEIYEKWSKSKYPHVSTSTEKGYVTAYKKLESIHNIEIKKIKLSQLQLIFDNSTHFSKSFLKDMKVLLNQVFNYAIKHDIIDKNYSEFIEIRSNFVSKDKNPFSIDEIKELLNNIDIPYVDVVIILIFTGFRIQELLNVKCTDVDLEYMIIKGGNKTNAGKNRIVPIHPIIQPYVKRRVKDNKEYLITNRSNDEKMTYSNFRRNIFNNIMKQLNMNHTLHESRHTFVTILNNSEANRTSISKLAGHTSVSFTEKVYTHKDIEELKKAINKIKI